MSKFDALEKANYVYAMKAFHEGQVDSQKAPYWLHPFRVSLRVKDIIINYGLGDVVDYYTAFKIALFHDVLEDTKYGIREVKAQFRDDEWEDAIFTLLLLTKSSIVIHRKLLSDPDIPDSVKVKWLKCVDDDVEKTYESGIEACMNHAPNLAYVIVKYCDNEDNSLAWRAKPPFKQNRKYEFTKPMLLNKIMEEIEKIDDPDIRHYLEMKTLYREDL